MDNIPLHNYRYIMIYLVLIHELFSVIVPLKPDRTIDVPIARLLCTTWPGGGGAMPGVVSAAEAFLQALWLGSKVAGKTIDVGNPMP